MSTYSGHSYLAAAKYLAGGRAKTYRPSGSTRYLVRQADGAISVVLHDTAVVTYHDDDTITLHHGGWRTVTTLRVINATVPFHVGSTYSKQYPGWGLGYTGELTPARVQKCRKCKGLGGTVTRRRCYGAPRWGETMCKGAQIEYGVPYFVNGIADWKAHQASAYTVPCEHGPAFEASHRTGHCEHGQRDAHDYGEIEAHACYQCKGDGTYDYGSASIPIVWPNGCAVRMTSGGSVVNLDAPYYAAIGKGIKSTVWVSPSQPSAPAMPTYGSEVRTKLAAVLPALSTATRCPMTPCRTDYGTGAISDVIVHLNDTHRWTRESIADWLDTLDADLRFPSTA